jgi:predicted RNA methylase
MIDRFIAAADNCYEVVCSLQRKIYYFPNSSTLKRPIPVFVKEIFVVKSYQEVRMLLRKNGIKWNANKDINFRTPFQMHGHTNSNDKIVVDL